MEGITGVSACGGFGCYRPAHRACPFRGVPAFLGGAAARTSHAAGHFRYQPVGTGGVRQHASLFSPGPALRYWSIIIWTDYQKSSGWRHLTRWSWIPIGVEDPPIRSKLTRDPISQK